MGVRYSIQGQASPSAVLTIYEADSLVLATIYSAQTGGIAVVGSTVTADSSGKATFYVDSDTYPVVSRFDIKASMDGYSDLWAYDVWSSFYIVFTVASLTGEGTTTFGDLRPQIQRNWGRSDAESQATILFYFNVAQRILARTHTFNELQKSKSFTMTIGLDDYVITGSPISLVNLRKIYSFSYVNSTRGYILEYVPPRKWDVEVAPSIPNASNSYPRLYTQWGNNITIYPPPNEAFTATLRYLSEPVSAVSTATVLDLIGMDEILVLITSAFCFFSVEEIEMGNAYMKQGANMLKLYGMEAELPKDLHMALSSSQMRASGDYWNDPFVGRTR